MVVLSLLSATGCTTKGAVFMSFDWLTYPDDWSCTDPNIDTPNPADILIRLQEYPTQPGDYYFEYYHSSSGVTRGIYYTLTAYQGPAFSSPQDAKFELFLWANVDPTFTQYQSLTGVDKGLLPGTTAVPAKASTQTNLPRIYQNVFVQ